MSFFKKTRAGLLFLILVFPGCEFADKVKDFVWGNEADMSYTKIKDFSDVVALFPKTAAEVKTQVEDAIAQAEKGFKKIFGIKDEERTFKNTARALDIIAGNFENKVGPLLVLQMLSTDKGIRDASQEAFVKAEQFSVDVFHSIELYKAFKAYVEGNAKKEDLNVEQKYFIDEAMKDFMRAGLSLPEAELEEVKKLKKEIAKQGMQFEVNINQDKSSIAVIREELAGLTDDFIEHLKKTDDGKYILYCNTPTITEVSSNCKVESTRKNLYLAYNNRAYPKNVEILEGMIGLRDKVAKKLGFKSFADLNINSEMAKTAAMAEGFIKDLIGKVQGKAEKEIQQLMLDLPEGVKLVEGDKFQPWDISYVKEWYKKKHFDVDARKIAEYFPMEKTVAALFGVYQKFFNLQFKLSKPSWSWHEEVDLIEIYNNDGSELLGYILLDLHPRENKYSHACHLGFVQGLKDRISTAVVIANFPKSTKDKPSLLKHDDVLTFFHEFGHAMHAVLGKTELAGFSGTNAKIDFVEMPSQMFEEWMWNKEVLKTVSGHYETDEPLPDELLEKMVELKKFDSGYFVLRQCVLSLIALNLFKEGAEKDSTKILQDLHNRYYKNIRLEPNSHMQASFGHLMGYGARYYGYMWSRVFAYDMFETIKKTGLLNPESGEKLVNEVLGKGGSVDPDELLLTFLGREPEQDAFLRELGFSV